MRDIDYPSYHIRRIEKFDQRDRAEGSVSLKLWLVCYASLAAMAALIALTAYTL